MKVFATSILILLSNLIFAQGVNSLHASAKSMSLGGANAVYLEDASAAYFNPAVTTQLETNGATAGVGLLSSKSGYINSYFSSEQENSVAPLLIPFHAYGAYNLDESMTVSLSINTPFGMGKRWEDNWTGKYISREFRFKTLQFQPTFSYLIREDLAVGAGIIVARSAMMYKSKLDYQNINATYNANAFGFGANIGVWGKITDATKYGVTFKTPIGYKYKKGEASLDSIPSLLTSIISDNEGVTSSFKTPYQLSLAMSNRINEKIYITYQFDLDGWKIYKSLDFDFDNEAIPDVSFDKSYKNAFAFRVGGEYKMNEEMQFRGGFYYKETPVADEYLSPEFPDASTLGYTLGGTYNITEEISVDLAILYENQAKRSFLNDQLQFEGTMKTLNYASVLSANYTF